MSDIKLNHKQKREEKKYFKEHTTHIKLTPGDIVFNIVNYAFFIVFTISCIFPFYYLFINTISDNELVTKGAITLLPKGLTISNYIQMGKVNDLWTSVLVTFLRTFIGTALMVFVSALAGYLVTKKEMWHRQFWYRFLVITMYFNAGLIPWYLNMSTLGLTDTFAAYIIPGIVSPYNIILVKTYIESIPSEIEESAYMDGASYWTIFRRIIWPLSKPILATIAIFGAVGHWNSFQDSERQFAGAFHASAQAVHIPAKKFKHQRYGSKRYKQRRYHSHCRTNEHQNYPVHHFNGYNNTDSVRIPLYAEVL